MVMLSIKEETHRQFLQASKGWTEKHGVVLNYDEFLQILLRSHFATLHPAESAMSDAQLEEDHKEHARLNAEQAEEYRLLNAQQNVC